MFYAPRQGPINEQVPDLSQMPMVTPEVEGAQRLPLSETNHASGMELQASWSGLNEDTLAGLGKALGMAFDQKQGTVRALGRRELEGMVSGPITAEQAQYQPVPGIGGLLGAGNQGAGTGEKEAGAVSGEGARPLASVPGANLSQPRAVGMPTHKFANYQAP